jgi:hypothetical protein
VWKESFKLLPFPPATIDILCVSSDVQVQGCVVLAGSAGLFEFKNLVIK